MKVTLEKYEITKGTTYKREFELDTNCIVLQKERCTIATIYGDLYHLSILCRDKEQVDFISVRVLYNNSNAVTCYHVDSVQYFENNEIKVLLRENDTL